MHDTDIDADDIITLEWQPTTWQTDAACRGLNPLMFFPARGEHVAAAQAVCNTCPVRVDCLNDALDVGTKYGIWGGTSERQRRQIRALIVRGAERDDAITTVMAPRTVSQCGTDSGYRAHFRTGIPVCEPCRDAHRAYARQRYAKRIAA